MLCTQQLLLSVSMDMQSSMQSMMAKLRSSTLLQLRIRMPKPRMAASLPIPSRVMFISAAAFLPLICSPSALLENLSMSAASMVPMRRMASGVRS